MTGKTLLCIGMVLVGMLVFSVIADAATIKNKTSQRLVISLTGGRTITLAAGGTSAISDADLSSPNVQTLIQRGKIQVVTTNKNKPAPPSKGKGRY